MPNTIGSNRNRLTARVVTPLVGNNDPKASPGQSKNLLPPAIPEFREAMQKYDRRALRRPSRDCMQLHIPVVEREVFKGGEIGWIIAGVHARVDAWSGALLRLPY